MELIIKKPYAEQITSVIENLAAGGAEVDHPLLRKAEKVSRVGVVVISSDRGLAGPYNSSVIRAAIAFPDLSASAYFSFNARAS